jgi:hypothetical protein
MNEEFELKRGGNGCQKTAKIRLTLTRVQLFTDFVRCNNVTTMDTDVVKSTKNKRGIEVIQSDTG